MNILFLAYGLMTSLYAQDFTLDKETGKPVPQYVGELKVMRGTAFKRSQGKTTPIKIGERFNKNDFIITKDASFVRLSIVDDTILTLGPNSEMAFAEFKFVSKTDRQMTFEVIRGQLRSKIQNKAKENEIQFKTSLAIMGVRGTELLINHQVLNNLAVSEFALIEGLADVTDNKGQKHPIAKADRVVIVQDSAANHLGVEKKLLQEELSKMLEKEDSFMPYIEMNTLNHDTFSWLNKPKVIISDEKKKEESVENSVNGPGWEENLKKLNNQLKENQKRK